MLKTYFSIVYSLILVILEYSISLKKQYGKFNINDKLIKTNKLYSQIYNHCKKLLELIGLIS